MPEPKPPTTPDLSTAEAIDRLAKAIISNAPKTPLEMTGMSEAKQKALVSRPPGKRYRMIPGKGPNTEATFTMLVVESKTHPEGRVTELHEYRHPEGTYLHESDGGLVPNGMKIYNESVPSDLRPGTEPPRGSLDAAYLHWRWTEFYQRDLREVIGSGERKQGALKAHLCRSDSGMKTPWLLAEVGAEEAAE